MSKVSGSGDGSIGRKCPDGGGRFPVVVVEGPDVGDTRRDCGCTSVVIADEHLGGETPEGNA